MLEDRFVTTVEARLDRGDAASAFAAPLDPTPHHAPLRWRWAAIVGVAGLVPWASVSWGQTRLGSLSIVLLWGVSAWAGARLVWVATSRQPRFFSVIFLVFCYVFAGVASLAQAVSSTYPLDNLDYSQSQVSRQALQLAVGLIAFELGHALTRWVRRTAPAPPTARSEYFVGIAQGRLLLIAAVGLASVVFLVAGHGVLAFFVSRAQTAAILSGLDEHTPLYLSTDKTGSLLTAFLAQYLIFVSLFLILYARRHRLWPSDPYIGVWGWRLVIAALVAGNVIMNNPVGNGRWWFLLIAVCLASVNLPVTVRRNVIIYAVAAIVILLLAFTFLDYFRSTDRIDRPEAERGLIGDSYPVLQMGLNGQGYVDQFGHTTGRQLEGALLGPVPRRFWPEKPIATGQVVDPQYARSASIWTEMYVDFGTGGVVVFFVLWGALAAAVDSRLNQAQPGMVPAFLTLLAAYQIFLLRGSLQPALGSLYQLAFLFVVASTFSRVPREGRAQ